MGAPRIEGARLPLSAGWKVRWRVWLWSLLAAAVVSFTLFAITSSGAICDTFDVETYALVNSPGPGEMYWPTLVLVVMAATAIVGGIGVATGTGGGEGRATVPPMLGTVLMLLPYLLVIAVTKGLLDEAVSGYDECSDSFEVATLWLFAVAPASMLALSAYVGRRLPT